MSSRSRLRRQCTDRTATRTQAITCPIRFVVPAKTAIPFARLRQVGTRRRFRRGIVAAAMTLASSSANERQTRVLANGPRRGTTRRHAIKLPTHTRQVHRDTKILRPTVATRTKITSSVSIWPSQSTCLETACPTTQARALGLMLTHADTDTDAQSDVAPGDALRLEGRHR